MEEKEVKKIFDKNLIRKREIQLTNKKPSSIVDKVRTTYLFSTRRNTQVG